MSIKRLIFVLLIIGSTLFGKVYTFNQICTMPKSYAKDFYIYQYLDQNISKDKANKLLQQVKRLSPKLHKKFTPYIDKFKRKKYCQSLKGREFLGRYGDCIKDGLSLYNATKINEPLLYKIAISVHTYDPKLELKYKTIAKKSFNKLIKLPPKDLLDTFNNVGGEFRKKYYDRELSSSIIQKLIKIKAFNTTIEKITRGAFNHISKSIVEIDSSSLNFESNFLLGLNAIKYGQLEYALRYFKLSQKKAPFTFEKDRALFWQYLLTKDNSLLDQLINSHEINIYSLRAYEIKGKFPKNIIYSIEPKTDKVAFDIKDPFAWIRFQQNFKKKKFNNYLEKKEYLLRYNSYDTQPHIAKLLYDFKQNIQYFLTPYSNYLKDTPTKRQVLIYALARQESRFIPTDISSSYALGMMQFMPFLAKDIAKRKGLKHFQYEDMFDPKTAYDFANYHLDFLEKNLNHPLFIAYAYNGGLGFTKRKILSQDYFKARAYEPFWSMEMVPNAQARKYGKRVLANYVIYSHLLGVNETLNSLLKKLR